MSTSDPLDRQSVQVHRSVLLAVEVLVEEETMLVVSGFLVKRGMIPHESVTLDMEEKMVLSSDALVVIWYSWDLSS